MCSSSVDPMPSSTGLPVSCANRVWMFAGSDSPAVTVARTLRNTLGSGPVSSSAAQNPGLEKNSVGASASIKREHCGRRRRGGIEDRGRAGGERERQRVAEPVGEEQLGDRQEAVVLGGRGAPRGRTSRRSPACCRARASRPSAHRSSRSSRARTPATIRTSRPPAPRRDRCGPPTHEAERRADVVSTPLASPHTTTCRTSGDAATMSATAPANVSDTTSAVAPESATIAPERGSLEHRRQRHRHDPGAQRPEEQRRERPRRPAPPSPAGRPARRPRPASRCCARHTSCCNSA